MMPTICSGRESSTPPPCALVTKRSCARTWPEKSGTTRHSISGSRFSKAVPLDTCDHSFRSRGTGSHPKPPVRKRKAEEDAELVADRRFCGPRFFWHHSPRHHSLPAPKRVPDTNPSPEAGNAAGRAYLDCPAARLATNSARRDNPGPGNG